MFFYRQRLEKGNNMVGPSPVECLPQEQYALFRYSYLLIEVPQSMANKEVKNLIINAKVNGIIRHLRIFLRHTFPQNDIKKRVKTISKFVFLK